MRFTAREEAQLLKLRRQLGSLLRAAGGLYCSRVEMIEAPTRKRGIRPPASLARRASMACRQTYQLFPRTEYRPDARAVAIGSVIRQLRLVLRSSARVENRGHIRGKRR